MFACLLLFDMHAVELRQRVGLVELSLEMNKLIRPLLDFRSFYIQFEVFDWFIYVISPWLSNL